MRSDNKNQNEKKSCATMDEPLNISANEIRDYILTLRSFRV